MQPCTMCGFKRRKSNSAFTNKLKRKKSKFGYADWYQFFYNNKTKAQEQFYEEVKCHYNKYYLFLEKEQVDGKILDFLDVPNSCGKINRSKLYKMVRKKKFRSNLDIQINAVWSLVDDKFVENEGANKRLKYKIFKSKNLTPNSKQNSLPVINRIITSKKKEVEERSLTLTENPDIKIGPLIKKVKFQNTVKVHVYSHTNSSRSAVERTAAPESTTAEESGKNVINENEQMKTQYEFESDLDDSFNSIVCDTAIMSLTEYDEEDEDYLLKSINTITINEKTDNNTNNGMDSTVPTPIVGRELLEITSTPEIFAKSPNNKLLEELSPPFIAPQSEFEIFEPINENQGQTDIIFSENANDWDKENYSPDNLDLNETIPSSCNNSNTSFQLSATEKPLEGTEEIGDQIQIRNSNHVEETSYAVTDVPSFTKYYQSNMKNIEKIIENRLVNLSVDSADNTDSTIFYEGKIILNPKDKCYTTNSRVSQIPRDKFHSRKPMLQVIENLGKTGESVQNSSPVADGYGESDSDFDSLRANAHNEQEINQANEFPFEERIAHVQKLKGKINLQDTPFHKENTKTDDTHLATNFELSVHNTSEDNIMYKENSSLRQNAANCISEESTEQLDYDPLDFQESKTYDSLHPLASHKQGYRSFTESLLIHNLENRPSRIVDSDEMSNEFLFEERLAHVQELKGKINLQDTPFHKEENTKADDRHLAANFELSVHNTCDDSSSRMYQENSSLRQNTASFISEESIQQLDYDPLDFKESKTNDSILPLASHKHTSTFKSFKNRASIESELIDNLENLPSRIVDSDELSQNDSTSSLNTLQNFTSLNINTSLRTSTPLPEDRIIASSSNTNLSQSRTSCSESILGKRYNRSESDSSSEPSTQFRTTKKIKRLSNIFKKSVNIHSDEENTVSGSLRKVANKGHISNTNTFDIVGNGKNNRQLLREINNEKNYSINNTTSLKRTSNSILIDEYDSIISSRSSGSLQSEGSGDFLGTPPSSFPSALEYDLSDANEVLHRRSFFMGSI